jgi:hypothetical protein
LGANGLGWVDWVGDGWVDAITDGDGWDGDGWVDVITDGIDDENEGVGKGKGNDGRINNGG